jgi:glucuronoarabinoxylan endo-1,4-beta-xylanase
MEGFGASLAYYENWLTAHPKKAEIYEAIFAELSLDILRVRNAHDYDSGMIDRVTEFAQAAESSLGKPIAILSSSWGPPGYLKSNNDRKNGGTLKFTESGNGIEFDYAGFAHWWNSSLDEYNSHGIYPTYISIQNEPDWAASWETCLLRPAETVNAADTIAGYNKALDAVYDTLMQRELKPKILGPECSGIGYNSVENFVNALDVSKIYGIAHHLYNGVDENDPWSSLNFTKVGDYHPEISHFQTEYSLGDWFSLAGLIYKSLHDENAVAYLYWDLIWDGDGLVSLDFPWDPSRCCTYAGELLDSLMKMPPHSVATVEMRISKITTGIPSLKIESTGNDIVFKSFYPNPFSHTATLEFSLNETQTIRMTILDMQVREINWQTLGTLPPGDHAIPIKRNGLSDGFYFYRLGNSRGEYKTGKFIIH